MIAVVYWSFPIIGSIFYRDENDSSLEGLLLTIMIIGISIGFVLAWLKMRIGEIILITGGTILSIFAYITAGRCKWLAISVSGVPFLVSGILFLISHYLDRTLKHDTK